MPNSLRLTSFLLLAFLLTACEKLVMDEEIVDELASPTDNGLVIRVANLESRAFENLSSWDSEDVCTHLNFAIYDLTGKRIKQVNQKPDDKNFGTVSLNLDAGQYQLVILAHSSNKNPTMTNLEKIQFNNAIGYTETFLYYTMLYVNEQPQTLSPTLSRIVAKCHFVINDPIPDDVTSIQFEYTGGSGHLNAKTGLGETNTTQTKTFTVVPGQTYTEYDLYTFLPDDEGTITLIATAFDASGSEYCAWEFQIPMKKNHITWLTGDFFTEETKDWTIIPKASIDSSWEGDDYYIF